MNSFDTALARKLHAFIAQQRKATEDIVLLGVCNDFTEYQFRIGKLKMLNEIETELGEIEAELKRG
jgi:hypothetical protein